MKGKNVSKSLLRLLDRSLGNIIYNTCKQMYYEYSFFLFADNFFFTLFTFENYFQMDTKIYGSIVCSNFLISFIRWIPVRKQCLPNVNICQVYREVEVIGPKTRFSKIITYLIYLHRNFIYLVISLV